MLAASTDFVTRDLHHAGNASQLAEIARELRRNIYFAHDFADHAGPFLSARVSWVAAS